jgi:hypothetical protein
MEMYSAECCGTVFVPGHGPDNIHEKDNSEYAAYREGDCPSCGAEKPDMDLVFVRK